VSNFTLEAPTDYEQIDNSPLRADENRALRLLLEKDRARQRWCRKMRFYLGGGAIGLGAIEAGHQLGLFDFLAGVIVRLRN